MMCQKGKFFMKKISILVIAALLITGMAGCGSAGASSSSAVPAASGAASEAPEDDKLLDGGSDSKLMLPPPGYEGTSEPAEAINFQDAMVEIIGESSKSAYTTDEMVDLTVIIRNTSDKNLLYVKGSGSSLVPDALQVKLGDLNPVFYPMIMTSDYQVEILEPGQSVSFECPFAPYISDAGEVVYGENDISFFKEGAFTPAPSGMIKGSISFAYMPLEGDASEIGLVDESKMTTLQGEFYVTIA